MTNDNPHDKTRRILDSIRKTNPRLATATERFLSEVKNCSEAAPEFGELLRLFPGKSFSDFCKRLVRNAGLQK